MARQKIPAHLMATQEGLVEPHVECIYCGYDLHGCDLHGNCPDCGNPIGATLTAKKREAKRKQNYDIDPRLIRKRSWLLLVAAIVVIGWPVLMMLRACSKIQ